MCPNLFVNLGIFLCVGCFSFVLSFSLSFSLSLSFCLDDASFTPAMKYSSSYFCINFQLVALVICIPLSCSLSVDARDLLMPPPSCCLSLKSCCLFL